MGCAERTPRPQLLLSRPPRGGTSLGLLDEQGSGVVPCLLVVRDMRTVAEGERFALPATAVRLHIPRSGAPAGESKYESKVWRPLHIIDSASPGLALFLHSKVLARAASELAS